MFSTRKLTTLLIALSLVLFAAGCKKKAAPPPPPPAPAVTPAPPMPAAPTIAQFSAEPTSIQRGQSSNLRWEVTGSVTGVSIDNGIGTVQSSGTRRVFPADSTTYTLTATGPGGRITASVTVTVTAPPPPPPPQQPAAARSLSDRLSEVRPAYFDYDKSDIRADARQVLTQDAAALKSILADFPNATVTIAGDCDARGSAEYNLGLGDRRAASAKDFLVALGVPADRLRTVSYGKEHANPSCTNEACWQQDRNVQFSAGQ